MNNHSNGERTFVRLTKSERIQHVILFVSTTLLIITGFMLMGEDWAIKLLGSTGKTLFHWRGIIHRVAAVAVSAVCFYHLYYVLFKAAGRSWISAMRPRLRDGMDAYQNVMYMLGKRESRPKLDRFTYLEKLEYFSVYFGMFIVISTGIMMWTQSYWPKFYLDIADVLHLGEATLAALAIIVGHIFSVHYNPHVYPMNRTFIDGNISETMMKDEHALWYEHLMTEEISQSSNSTDGGRSDAKK